MRHKAKLRYAALIFALMIAMIIPAGTAEASGKLKLNRTKVTMCAGETAKLKVTNSDSTVTWKSSDKTVATVTKSGKVKGKKAGTCTITAKVGKKSVKCKVTIMKHQWYTVEETGHYEKVTMWKCRCGEKFYTDEDFQRHESEHLTNNGTKYRYYVYDKRQWVVDEEEYEECMNCGKQKS